MPLFEYICRDCGQPFEALVLSNSSPDEITCPACHSQNINKQISTFASKLSGGGSNLPPGSAGISCSTGSV